MSAAERIPSRTVRRVGTGAEDAAADDLAPAVGRSRTLGRARRGAASGARGSALTCGSCARRRPARAGRVSVRSRDRAAREPRRSAISASTPSSSSRRWGDRDVRAPALPCAARGAARPAHLDLRQRARPRAAGGGAVGRTRSSSSRHPLLGRRGTRALTEALLLGPLADRHGCERSAQRRADRAAPPARGKRRHDRRHDLAPPCGIRAASTRACSGARSSFRRRAALNG